MALTRDALLEHMCDQFDLERDEVEDGTLLFTSGMLDSFSMISLVGFIEKAEGIKIGPNEFTLENLDSLERILRFVESKR